MLSNLAKQSLRRLSRSPTRLNPKKHNYKQLFTMEELNAHKQTYKYKSANRPGAVSEITIWVGFFMFALFPHFIGMNNIFKHILTGNSSYNYRLEEGYRAASIGPEGSA